jgi:hypothetical protein
MKKGQTEGQNFQRSIRSAALRLFPEGDNGTRSRPRVCMNSSLASGVSRVLIPRTVVFILRTEGNCSTRGLAIASIEGRFFLEGIWLTASLPFSHD